MLQAWYPGTSGGRGHRQHAVRQVNPSGRLPISFPKRREPVRARGSRGERRAGQADAEVNYKEGATVGYKWHGCATGSQPLFPFGFGLSYTQFAYSGLQARLEGAGAGGEIPGSQHRATRWKRCAAGLRVAVRGWMGSAQAPGRLAQGRLQDGRGHRGRASRGSAPARGVQREPTMAGALRRARTR